jgi:metal-responsive CopG/Arc/MetJ family transcriptional regulator
MRAIRFTIDDELLGRIDRHPATKLHGRSAFLRAAAWQFLRRHHAEEIQEAYRSGYGKHPPTVDEFEADPGALAWPGE